MITSSSSNSTESGAIDVAEYDYPTEPMRWVVEEVLHDHLLFGYARRDETPQFDADGALLPPTRHCVYTLECQQPVVPDFDAYVNRKLEQRTDDKAPIRWDSAALSASRVFYVGYTGNIFERLVRHTCDAQSGSLFTAVFPPERLHRIDWYETKAEAGKAETDTADEMRSTEDWFVYSI